MIWTGLVTSLNKICGKMAFKVGLFVVIGLACYFKAVEWKDAAVEARDQMWRNAPAAMDTIVKIQTITLRDTMYKYIQGRVDTVTIDVSSLTLKQLQAAVQPFSISQPITVTDDKEKVGVAFDMSLTARPLEHSVTGLTFSNIRSTYPKETVTITKTVFEPYHANLIDLFVESKIGGVFGVKGLAGYAQTGVDINIGAVQISGGIGAASQNNKLHGLWVVGAKVSTR